MPSLHISWSLLSAKGATAALGILLAALVLSTVTDLSRRRIPNSVTFSAALLGLVLHGLYGGFPGLLSSFVGFAIWLTVGIGFWSMSRGQGIGAGDVKMAAATAALLGLLPTFWVVFLSNLLQVTYLFLRWIVQGTAWVNFKQVYTWIFSIVSPG